MHALAKGKGRGQENWCFFLVGECGWAERGGGLRKSGAEKGVEVGVWSGNMCAGKWVWVWVGMQ